MLVLTLGKRMLSNNILRKQIHTAHRTERKPIKGFELLRTNNFVKIIETYKMITMLNYISCWYRWHYR